MRMGHTFIGTSVLSVVVVLTAVKLHEFGIRTEEIDDKAINRHLPFELPSGQPAIT